MEPLNTAELTALKAWMADKGLSQDAAATALGVSDTTIIGWKKGGKVRPTAREKLLAAITPYLKPVDQFPDATKIVPAEIRPSLQTIYAKLCELEDRGTLPQLSAIIDQLTSLWPKPKPAEIQPDLVSRILGSGFLKPLGLIDQIGRWIGPEVRKSNDGKHFVEIGKGPASQRFDCASADEAEFLFKLFNRMRQLSEAPPPRSEAEPGNPRPSRTPPERPKLSPPVPWPLHPADKPMPCLDGVAAGPARTPQLSQILAKVPGYESDLALTLVTLEGESMEPSFPHASKILFRSFPAPVILGDDADYHIPLSRIRAEVSSGDAVILSLDQGETVTCKRIVLRGQDDSWGLWLFADNPDEPGYPRLVRKKDHLTIYGRVLGLADTRQLDEKDQ